jgi:translation initiation factor IF-3
LKTIAISDKITKTIKLRRSLLAISTYTRLNEKIRAPQLRVITEDGSQLGIMSRNEALAEAERVGLDLVEISPQANPPVAKIVDWGKFNYQRTKQLQKNKRNARVSELKQIRVGLKISDHDLGVKAKKTQEFLEEGHKVKYSLVYRGREMAHRDIGYVLAQKIIDSFGDGIVVDQQPVFAGKQLTFVIRRA